MARFTANFHSGLFTLFGKWRLYNQIWAISLKKISSHCQENLHLKNLECYHQHWRKKNKKLSVKWKIPSTSFFSNIFYQLHEANLAVIHCGKFNLLCIPQQWCWSGMKTKSRRFKLLSKKVIFDRTNLISSFFLQHPFKKNLFKCHK